MKVNISNKTIYNIGLYLFFVFSYLAESISWGNYVIAGSLLIMLATKLFLERPLRVNKSDFSLLLWIFIFTIYTCSSRFWAENASLTVGKSNAMLFVLLAMIVIVICKYERFSINTLLKIIMYGGYTVGFYALMRYGLQGIISLLQNETRFGAIFNSNTLGMCVAYSLLINLFFLIYMRKANLLDILMAPMLIILISTGSRKAILIFFGGLFALLVLKNISNKKALISLLKTFAIIILLLIAGFFALKLPFMSRISSRLESLLVVLRGEGSRSTDGWLRVQYVKLGIELFKEHPLFGIGLGNANIYTKLAWGHDHYLHNNYVEMLATLGIVGTAIYYSIYLYFLRVFWSKRKNGMSAEFNICLIILVLRLIMDYGAVFFYSKSTCIFILLFWVEAAQLKSGICSDNLSQSSLIHEKI